MSASRDHSQSSAFLYSSFYELYLKAKYSENLRSGLAKGVVLKRAEVKTISREDADSIHEWMMFGNQEVRKHINPHLNTLQEAGKRLSFMVHELDELLKRD